MKAIEIINSTALSARLLSLMPKRVIRYILAIIIIILIEMQINKK